jgi:hypothetical protein
MGDIEGESEAKWELEKEPDDVDEADKEVRCDIGCVDVAQVDGLSEPDAAGDADWLELDDTDVEELSVCVADED